MKDGATPNSASITEGPCSLRKLLNNCVAGCVAGLTTGGDRYQTEAFNNNKRDIPG